RSGLEVLPAPSHGGSAGPAGLAGPLPERGAAPVPARRRSVIWAILAILLLPVLVAPFETAGWWTQRRQRHTVLPIRPPKAPEGKRAQLVYFTGVAGYSG